MPLSDEDIREILRIVDETPLGELRVETDGFSLHVVKGAPPPAAAPDEPPAPAAAPAPTAKPPHDPAAADLVTVGAPMLGVFYRAEGPGKPPFVEPGSEVEPDTTVCIIEVMKMMNSVPAGTAGTVVEVCQENGSVVEEGTPLFRIRPG
jgi:acetyl-CoA carboxylase biotin carboxyl carrier protein